MKPWTALCIFLVGALPVHGQNENPIAKVIQLLSDLEKKIISEGAEAQKVFNEFAEWCEETSKNLQFDIKTGKAQAAELKATIDQAVADLESLGSTIEEISGSIATDAADLKAATQIRVKEHADFAAAEKELVDTIDIIERAIGILEREAQTVPGASLVQMREALNGSGNLVQALSTMVEASGLNSKDASKLTALLQSQQEPEDDDAATGAPAPDAYQHHSSGIIEVLEKLLSEAEDQLAGARKDETTSQHNYELLKQSLEDSIAVSKKNLDKAKKGVAESGEIKATAEGDLEVTAKGLAEDIKSLAETKHDCMTRAEDFEAATKSRGEELKALAEAKKIISAATGGATAITYDIQTSFLQTARSQLRTGADLANFEAVRFVRNLAKQQNSAALAQLASRMESSMRFGSAAGDDPFAKVKGLISDMIARLVKEAAEDASHKAYCDKEMAETKAKKDDLSAEIKTLTGKINLMKARSDKLKGEVAELQKELAELAKSQADMDALRQQEHEAYVTNRADLEQGVTGVKLALKILREYYAKEDKAHDAAEGSASGIIGLLEVAESDFSKGLAETIAAEETAQREYDQQTKENEIEKATKSKDVEYKTKEAARLDKGIAELSSDRDGAAEELKAVLEYWKSIQEQCIAKPEPYEERKRRREAEIAGLKEALTILEGESFLQVRRHQALRGSQA